MRGVARSARKSRRRFGGALEPLTRVRAELGRARRARPASASNRSRPRARSRRCSPIPQLQAACAVLLRDRARPSASEGQAEPDGVPPDRRGARGARERGSTPGSLRALLRVLDAAPARAAARLGACAACGAALAPTIRRSSVAGRRAALLGVRARPGRPRRALSRADRAFLAAAARCPRARREHAAAARPRRGARALCCAARSRPSSSGASGPIGTSRRERAGRRGAP